MKYGIERFLAQRGTWQLWVNGIPVTDLRCDQFATSIEFGKLIFSFWSDDFSQSWRVVGFEAQSLRLRLRLMRKMGDEQVAVELRAPEVAEDADPGPVDRRHRFLQQLMYSLRSHFHAVEFESAGTGPTAVPGLSSVYSRLVFKSGPDRIAALGTSNETSDQLIDELLAAGVLWLESLGFREPPVKKCLLIAPGNRSKTLARRMTALRPEVANRLELYEWSASEGELKPIQPVDQGSLFDPALTKLPPMLSARRASLTELESLKSLPDGVRVFHHPIRGTISVRCHGLELARLNRAGCRLNTFVVRGAGLARAGRSLKRLAEKVTSVRNANSRTRWHPLYRWQGERWMEEMIRDDLTTIDPELDPRFVYPQIPALEMGDRRMVDLLTIRSDGRLVILELKTREDLDLPLQGVDYWLRVEWHRQRRDFERRGYFPGKVIAGVPAVLYLVAPVLQFHRGFDCIARSISPALPAYRIGINENWRAGIKVLRRDRLSERSDVH